MYMCNSQERYSVKIINYSHTDYRHVNVDIIDVSFTAIQLSDSQQCPRYRMHVNIYFFVIGSTCISYLVLVKF